MHNGYDAWGNSGGQRRREGLLSLKAAMLRFLDSICPLGWIVYNTGAALLGAAHNGM
jgi:hypothetical protein